MGSRSGSPGPKLVDGSRVAVVGGGPAGAFFSFFLLQLARRVGLAVAVDIYEPRDFAATGPAGCNMCGGVISESLVQELALEGIVLPSRVVQRGIDSYVLHTDEGSVRIATPLEEKRIAVVHRGGGPRAVGDARWGSFDAFLLGLAGKAGATVVRRRVDGLAMEAGRPVVTARGASPSAYDLVVGAVGVNGGATKLFADLGLAYRPPRTVRAYICELHLGQGAVDRCLGTSMHVFLLALPGLEFAALIPKGDDVTACLLGSAIDRPLVAAFLASPEVRACLPPGWTLPDGLCHCSPHLSVGAAVRPFADRMVLVGDCAVTRLYKDGNGAAYRTAKAAAVTAVFDGIGAVDFARGYARLCGDIARDNAVGRAMFSMTRLLKRWPQARRALLRSVAREQRRAGARPLSGALWDLFTGSAPYRDVARNAVRPAMIGRLLGDVAREMVAP